MRVGKLTESDREVVESFQNFLAQAGTLGSKLYPRPDDPPLYVARPWPPALYAYAWGYTQHCPPPGEL